MELKISGLDAIEDRRLLKHAKRLNPDGQELVFSWLLRPSPSAEPAEVVLSRREIFERLSRQRLAAFLEVEIGPHGIDHAEALFRRAAAVNLPLKLSWHGEASGELLALAAKFPICAIDRVTSIHGDMNKRLAACRSIVVLEPSRQLIENDKGLMDGRAYLNSGGALALGSGYDPVQNPVLNMQLAVALAVWRHGLTIEEAITAATANAAYASGIGAEAGTIECGKRADLVLLNLSDYRDLPRQIGVNHVGMVIRNGTVVFNRIGWKSSKP